MPVHEPHLENVSLQQVQVFTPRFEFQAGNIFMAQGSCFVAMGSNEDILQNNVGVNAWMEIKELMIELISPTEFT